ncbi:MAG: rhodanese-like domain-containing protein [Actinomycetota bacterium]|nr:rhodanese-like domain-containing protein [Actinomycetota bacterium]
MPKEILIDELRGLMDAGAQLLEVLAKDQFDKEHIPGAIHIPLEGIDRHTIKRLDPGKPVVVYCFDYI